MELIYYVAASPRKEIHIFSDVSSEAIAAVAYTKKKPHQRSSVPKIPSMIQRFILKSTPFSPE